MKKGITNVVKRRKNRKTPRFDGDSKLTFSTGSTLLDLAISGGRTRRGGVPSGILVEVFGPSGSGKTVLLSEIAGSVQRKGGAVKFIDPEARLDKKFAEIFGLKADEMDYSRIGTVEKVFQSVRKWKPPDEDVVNGVFVDSLAALSTELEVEKDGDAMGTSRSRKFSEQLRMTCREITERNLLVVCSNQVRDNINAGPWGVREKSTGGRGPEFYSSLRLRTYKSKIIMGSKTVHGKKVKRPIGVIARIVIDKSSIWIPGRDALVTIIFDFGIDDTKDNLQFLKDYSTKNTYFVGEKNLGRSIDAACRMIEDQKLEKVLKKQVIKLWYEIDDKFKTKRVKRRV